MERWDAITRRGWEDVKTRISRVSSLLKLKLCLINGTINYFRSFVTIHCKLKQNSVLFVGLYRWPCRSSGGYSTASHRGGPGHVLRDLWWTKRHWSMLCPSTSVSPAKHSTDCFSLIIQDLYIRLAVASVIVDSFYFTPTPPPQIVESGMLTGHVRFAFTMIMQPSQNVVSSSSWLLFPLGHTSADVKMISLTYRIGNGEVMNVWSGPPTPYIAVLCLIKGRDNFIFTYRAHLERRVDK
jgi:hypothetical protein